MNKEIIRDAKERGDFFEYFLANYQAFSAGIVGKSILSRDIHYYKIGRGKRCVAVVGAHHGMEHITSSAIFEFLKFMCENAARGGSFCGVNIDFLLDRYTYFIIPCANPDGVEIEIHGRGENPLSERLLRMNGGSEDFTRWQANARGVDLNHNYNCGFFEYKRIEAREGIVPGRTRFSGEFPESEPESRAIAGFIRALMPCAVLSLHSQGAEVFFSPTDAKTRRVAERIAKAAGYEVSIPKGHAAYGGLCDYTGGVLKIPSFTVEVGRGENPLPQEQLNRISDDVRKILLLLPASL